MLAVLMPVYKNNELETLQMQSKYQGLLRGKSNESNGHSLRALKNMFVSIFSLFGQKPRRHLAAHTHTHTHTHSQMHAHVHIHASSPREIIIFPLGSPLAANLQH